MATITARTNDRVFSVQKWYGLNEHPDGDTRLRLGEASKMVNWRITRDGNLKLRPGQEFVAGLGPTYSAVLSGEIVKLSDYVKASELAEYYDSVSGDSGKVVPTDTSGGVVENGILSVGDAEVKNGVLHLPSDIWSVSDGVLSGSQGSGTLLSFSALYDELQALAPETYLYIAADGAMYAIDHNCLLPNGDGYTLYGIPMYAKADPADTKPIVALWSGVLGGKDVLLAACDDTIWSLYDADTDSYGATAVGAVNTGKGVHFFQFDGIVYILNGYEYYQYDGINIVPVVGYVPLVAISIGPTASADAGELTSEYVNLLINKRRVWLSPDGNTNKTFKLPEKAKAIVSAKYLDGSADPTYTFTANTDTITFTSTLSAAVNSIEVTYSVKTHSDDALIQDYRSQVASMLFSEFYSGTTDTRIFLYGDGSNKAIYSGMDYDGMPRADYYPDQYEVLIGDANEPITDMIRHGGALIAYKPRECWSLQHGVVELATGDLTPSIYCTPVNREKGNVAPGQVQLVENSPVTVSGTELYKWGSVSRYSSAIGRDERNASRISDRIQKSIKEIDFKTCRMWDDNDNQEFYLIGDGMALVWNYALDAWYRYENFDCTAMCSFHGDLYVGSHDGKIRRMSDYVVGDDGYAIKADWQSGAIDFGAAYSRKYSAALWVGLKPVEGTSVDVTVITDRKNTFLEKNVSSEKAKIPGEPFMAKTKLKAKKFVYYRLILKVEKKMLPVTVTNVEIRVRMTSDAK